MNAVREPFAGGPSPKGMRMLVPAAALFLVLLVAACGAGEPGAVGGSTGAADDAPPPTVPAPDTSQLYEADGIVLEDAKPRPRALPRRSRAVAPAAMRRRAPGELGLGRGRRRPVRVRHDLGRVPRRRHVRRRRPHGHGRRTGAARRARRRVRHGSQLHDLLPRARGRLAGGRDRGCSRGGVRRRLGRRAGTAGPCRPLGRLRRQSHARGGRPGDGRRHAGRQDHERRRDR